MKEGKGENSEGQPKDVMEREFILSHALKREELPLLQGDQGDPFTPECILLYGDKISIKIILSDASLENFRRAMIELAEIPEAREVMKKYGLAVREEVYK